MNLTMHESTFAREQAAGRIHVKVFSLRALCLIVLAAATAFSQTPQSASDVQSSTRPLTMLVVGDSILWGQGLKDEHKSWYYVKEWLQKHTGRTVNERIEAHSGAVIERTSDTENLVSANREVNLGLPTIHEQLDNALRFYSNASQVDLVLVSGCGNDVGVEHLLNSSDINEVNERTETKCGSPMEKLLRRITSSFPAAKVIVTGYYPFFSELTKNDFVSRALARRFFKTRSNRSRMSSREVFERLKINSKAWHEASDKSLAETVRKVNAALFDQTQRVMFARIDFPPEYSFAAGKSRLWALNRSPFRMFLVIVSFGKILLPPNDEARKYRTAGCNDIYREPPNETPEQKKERKKRRLYCRYAALAHPNRMGAVVYADAVTNLLRSIYSPNTP